MWRGDLAAVSSRSAPQLTRNETGIALAVERDQLGQDIGCASTQLEGRRLATARGWRVGTKGNSKDDGQQWSKELVQLRGSDENAYWRDTHIRLDKQHIVVEDGLYNVNQAANRTRSTRESLVDTLGDPANEVREHTGHCSVGAHASEGSETMTLGIGERMSRCVAGRVSGQVGEL